MKKRVLAFALALLCACSLLAPPVFAADNYVYDTTGAALTQEQWQTLENYAAQISQDYDCGVYIAVVEDYRNYGSSIEYASENIYRDNGFGRHSDASGILLLMSMTDRRYDIYANGFGTYALGSYGRDTLRDMMVDDFRNNDWYTGFSDYLNGCATLMKEGYEAYESGVTRSAGPNPGFCIGAGVIVGCVVALIVCSIMKSKMRSVKKAQTAQFYAVPGSMDVYESSDVFTHVTETRVKIESDSDRGGGGDRPSGGGSHGGGSF